MKKHKKVITIIVSCAAAAALVVGIGTAVRATTGSAVPVYNVSDLNMGYYAGGQSTLGIVVSDASQNVYLTGAEKVASVNVREGDTVKKGDVLMTYDITATNLSLQRLDISKQQLELQIDVTERNVATLEKLRPAAGGSGGSYDPGWDNGEIIDPGEVTPTPTPTPTEAPKKDPDWSTLTRWHELTGEAVPYNKEKADGSKAKPFRYAVTTLDDNGKETGTVILTPEFVDRLLEEAAKSPNPKEYYIAADIVDANGNLLQTTLVNAGTWEKNSRVSIDMSERDMSVTTPVSILDENAAAYNETEENAGTEEVPYLFLVSTPEGTDTVTMTAAFLQKIHAEDPAAFIGAERIDAAGKKVKTLKIDTSTLDDAKNYLIDFAAGQVTPEGETDPAGTSDPTQDGGQTGTSASVQDGGQTGASVPMRDGGTTTASASTGEIFVRNGKIYAGYAEFASATKILAPRIVLDTDEGGDSYSGSLRLIPSDAEYSEQDLKDARKAESEKLETLKLDAAELDIKLRQAEKAASDGTVKATVDGVVKAAGDPEDPPTDGSAFLTVAGSGGMYIKSAVSELYLDRIKVGSTILANSWRTGTMLEATITEISPYPDTSGQFSGYFGAAGAAASMYPFTAEIVGDAGDLRANEYLDVLVQGEEQTEEQSALFLDDAFIREDTNGQKYVYIRDENGRIARRDVVTGKMSYGGTEIKEGITTEDQIAFPYGRDLKIGAKTREATLDELYS